LRDHLVSDVELKQVLSKVCLPALAGTGTLRQNHWTVEILEQVPHFKTSKGST
jgi:hypothetical protein